MNAKLARKIVKDNNLDIDIKARTNGDIHIMNYDADDLLALDNLLNGMGFYLNHAYGNILIEKKVVA